MISLQRLTLDSSWFFEWQGIRAIIDPWLVGPEIDSFSWLNKQWHQLDPVAPQLLPEFQFVLISQSYEDHCHLQTLSEIDQAIPIFASGKAYDKLRKHFRSRHISLIPEFASGESLQYEGFKFQAIHPGNWLDPIYFAILITSPGGETIFYAPHGFHLKKWQQDVLAERDIAMLFTTFTDFRLPAIMGGHVNPGLDHARWLEQVLNPRWIVNTHDEEKRAAGLVSKLAKVKYPDYEEASSFFGSRFREIPDYGLYKFSP
ncbi:MAG: MBL fold metallo-hydrolase [Saprospiraceae bacterium]|nr:MBL fold metallo-hydrolase [Saprospiraceae bacterium]